MFLFNNRDGLLNLLRVNQKGSARNAGIKQNLFRYMNLLDF